MKLLFVITLLFSVEVHAQTVTVLSGTPFVKVLSTPVDTQRVILTPEQKLEFQSVIEQRQGKYYWISREDRELFHAVSGAFHHFIDLKGGGYVKVFALDEGKGFAYVEHINLGLNTITYWGSARRFEP